MVASGGILMHSGSIQNYLGSFGKRSHMVSYRHGNFFEHYRLVAFVCLLFMHLRVCVNMWEESSRCYGKYSVVVLYGSIVVIMNI